MKAITLVLQRFHLLNIDTLLKPLLSEIMKIYVCSSMYLLGTTITIFLFSLAGYYVSWGFLVVPTCQSLVVFVFLGGKEWRKKSWTGKV